MKVLIFLKTDINVIPTYDNWFTNLNQIKLKNVLKLYVRNYFIEKVLINIFLKK